MYISNLKLEFYRVENGYKQYFFKKPLIVMTDKFNLTVNTNFKTDLASIPKPLNKIFKRNNPKYARSVIVHDYMYVSRLNRYLADKTLYKCMRYEGNTLLKSVSFFIAVRAFGWIRYNAIIKNSTKNI